MIKKASDETDNVLCEYTEDEKSTITHIGFRTIPGAAPRFQECHPGYFPQYLNESIEADDGIYWVPTSGRDEQVVRINKDQIVYDSNMQRSVIRQDTVNNKLKDNRMSNFKSKTKKASDDEMELLLDGSRGVYIPKNFVECYSPEEWHLSPEVAEILAKEPEGNDYWEAWDEALNTAFYEKDGKKYTLYQGESGDLFAVPEGYDWDRYSSSKRLKIKKASDKPIVIYYNPETIDMRGNGVEKVVVDGEVYKGFAGLEALLGSLIEDNPEFVDYEQHIYFDGNSAGAFLNLDYTPGTEDSEAAYEKVNNWIGNNVTMRPISEFKEEPEDDHMARFKSKTKSAKREILYLNSRTAALTVGSDFDCTEDAAKKIASEIGQLDNVERYHMSGDKLVFSFEKPIKKAYDEFGSDRDQYSETDEQWRKDLEFDNSDSSNNYYEEDAELDDDEIKYKKAQKVVIDKFISIFGDRCVPWDEVEQALTTDELKFFRVQNYYNAQDYVWDKIKASGFNYHSYDTTIWDDDMRLITKHPNEYDNYVGLVTLKPYQSAYKLYFGQN